MTSFAGDSNDIGVESLPSNSSLHCADLRSLDCPQNPTSRATCPGLSEREVEVVNQAFADDGDE